MNRLKGFTLIEVLVSSLIATTIAGGTLMAFVTAARLARQGNSAASLEATGLAQETIESHRNEIGADSLFLNAANLGRWIAEPPTPNSDTESIFQQGPVERYYRVTAEDCDRDGNMGDCYAMQVKVCWNNEQPCP